MDDGTEQAHEVGNISPWRLGPVTDTTLVDPGVGGIAMGSARTSSQARIGTYTVGSERARRCDTRRSVHLVCRPQPDGFAGWGGKDEAINAKIGAAEPSALMVVVRCGCSDPAPVSCSVQFLLPVPIWLVPSFSQTS